MKAINNAIVSLAVLSMLWSAGALACSDSHDYVETSRTRVTYDIASVFALTGPNSHLANVTAMRENGHMILLTIPGQSAAAGGRLVVEEVRLEDRSNKHGAPVFKYDFVEAYAD